MKPLHENSGKKSREFKIWKLFVVDYVIRQLIAGWADWNKVINRHHNHVEFDKTKGVWIHRKGATHAEQGMMGVVPGNMRDGTFIVEGQGCSDSLCSSSHGAGRIMSRAEAKKQVSMDDFAQAMEGIAAKVNDHTLDESPMCYKPIDQVMADQTDLVRVLHRIVPIINVKG